MYYEERVINYFINIDFAAFAGVGVKIFFINVEARYHWGLLEVREGLNNRYFQIGAAFNF